MNTKARPMALGGVTAALAVVLMCLGTLLPVATYMLPVLLCLMLGFLKPTLGKKLGFAWYLTVALLGLLLAPDKEAAAIFAFLGYYPLIKPWMDGRRLAPLWKLVLFNTVILSVYWALMHVFGMAQLQTEFQEMGKAMTVATLILGNLTFFLVDALLGRKLVRRRK